MTPPLYHACARCAHSWPARVVRPVKCPRCGSPYWWIARGVLPPGPRPRRSPYKRPEPDPTKIARPRPAYCLNCCRRQPHEGGRCQVCGFSREQEPAAAPQ